MISLSSAAFLHRTALLLDAIGLREVLALKKRIGNPQLVSGTHLQWRPSRRTP
jgi:hypothetical protein